MSINSSSARYYLSLIVILSIGLTTTTIVSQWFKNQAWDILSRDFDRISFSYSDFVYDMFDRRLEELYSIKRFYDASEHINRKEFSLYVSHLLKREAAFKALMWTPRVAKNQLVDFEKLTSDELGRPYQVHNFLRHNNKVDSIPHNKTYHQHSSSSNKIKMLPLGYYTPILYAEPLAHNLNALGFNLSSENARADTMKRALIQNKAIASERITLIHQNNDPTGFIIVLPVFNKQLDKNSELKYKESALQGFIIGRMSARDVMQSSLKGKNVNDLVISLVDEKVDKDKKVMASVGGMSSYSNVQIDTTALQFNRKMEFAGHNWIVEVKATKEFVSSNLAKGYILILVIGLVLTLMIVVYVHALYNQRQRAEKIVEKRTSELRASKARLSEAQHIASIGSWELNHSDGSLLWSDEVFHIFDVDPKRFKVNYESFKALLSQEGRQLLEHAFSAHINDGIAYNIVHKLKFPDGRIKHLQERCQTHFSPNGVPEVSIGTVQDISERKETEARIAYLAHHDMLTGLPNRILFRERFEQALAHARRNHYQIALIFFDLDRFKFINDSLGHPTGDELLCEVANRLKTNIREADILGRHGGDEFLLAITDIVDIHAVDKILEKILYSIRKHFQLKEHNLAVSCSMGIAVYPDNGNDFDSMLRMADTAMYSAKEASRDTYRYYSNNMNDDMLERLEILSNMRIAIEKEQFDLHYQPQIEVSTGQIIGSEALIRWKDDSGQYIRPDKFIPIAEDSGLILPIGRWVLKKACHQLSFWQKNGHENLSMAINLSALQLQQDELHKEISKEFQITGISPSSIELELTETVLLQDVNKSLNMVRLLKDVGVKLAIDDFGTGYSSLSYLKRLNADKLKIDRSFVKDLPDDQDSIAINRAIIQMSHELGIRVVAEGVENEVQANLLKDMGCDIIQGYFYGRPMKAKEFTQMLNDSGNNIKLT